MLFPNPCDVKASARDRLIVFYSRVVLFCIITFKLTLSFSCVCICMCVWWIMESQSASSNAPPAIFFHDPLDPKDALEEVRNTTTTRNNNNVSMCWICLQEWKAHYQHVGSILGKEASVSQAQLGQRASSDPVGTVQGCLYGILANPQHSMAFWKSILRVSDGVEIAVRETEKLIKEKMVKFTRRSKNQVSQMKSSVIRSGVSEWYMVVVFIMGLIYRYYGFWMNSSWKIDLKWNRYWKW
jgi:hypothetical protein